MGSGESSWLNQPPPATQSTSRHQQTGPDTAIVEFVARFRADGRGHRLHETSRFVREDGRWYYVDGDFDGT